MLHNSSIVYIVTNKLPYLVLSENFGGFFSESDLLVSVTLCLDEATRLTALKLEPILSMIAFLRTN